MLRWAQQGGDTEAAAFLDQRLLAEQLKAVARWMMRLQLAGQMPTLPSQNSSLRARLMANQTYLDLLVQVSDRNGLWIEAGQQAVVGEHHQPLDVVGVSAAVDLSQDGVEAGHATGAQFVHPGR